MKTLASEYVIFVDVDGTLVSHDLELPGKIMYVNDPINKNKTIQVVENAAMVRLVREEKHRGATVIVWSRGGYEWAENVIRTLGLEDIVTMVMSKPVSYLDDVKIEEWLTHRVFLPLGAKYKNVHPD